MTQPLHPSEFIALTSHPTQDNTPVRVGSYNMVPGTVVRLRNSIFVLVAALKGPHQWIHSLSHEQFAARMHADNTDTLPVILFDPLDTNTNTDTDEKE